MDNAISKKTVLSAMGILFLTVLIFSCEREDIVPAQIAEQKPIAIIDVNPKQGAVGDIIKITGTNFSPLAFNNKVRFSTDDALGRVTNSVILGATEIATIYVRVPENATTGPVSVTLEDFMDQTTYNFSVLSTISLFSPSVGKVGSTVVISGSNFNPEASGNKVFFNDIEAVVNNATSNSLEVTVPDGFSEAAITVESYGLAVTSTSTFKVLDVVTKTFSIPVRSDVEENQFSGISYGTSSDIELGRYDTFNTQGNQRIGLHFANVQIPPGATITKAYLQFIADVSGGDNGGADPTQMTIYAEDSGAPVDFDFTTAFDLRDRPRTAGVVWDIPEWKSFGDRLPAQRSSDLTAIIQSIINKSEWASGNNVNFIMVPTGPSANITADSKNLGRRASTLDNDQGPTELVVEYY